MGFSLSRTSAVSPDQFATFGELLKYLRRRAGLTQRELSIAVGYSESQISRLEQNQRVPDQATLTALFVPALRIEREPEWTAQLLERAAAARQAATPSPRASAAPTIPDHELLFERLRRSRLIGRADPQRRLIERLDRLNNGAGGVVLVSGEPGIGKTRLLDETVAAARSRGVQVLIGRCHERDVAIPYMPIADALEAYARRCAPATWERLLQAAGPGIAMLLSDNDWKYLQWGGVVGPEASTLLTVPADDMRPGRAVRALLKEIGRDAPVLLVVDDLHWADPPSLDLLHHLALRTRDMPLLILGAYREIELERAHPLSQLLVDLNHERLLVRERLPRLDAAETQALLSEILGGPPPPGLAEVIQEQTEGNPFFVEELVNGLVETGRLVWNKPTAGYVLAPGVMVEALAGETPQGVRAAIGQRLDHLDPTTQQALGLASVIGRRFSVGILNRLAAAHGLSEVEVEQALARARAARLITALDPLVAPRDDLAGFTAGAPELEADYSFDHPLLHQVVYAELDRRRQRRLHGEVGSLLEDLYRGRVGLYAEAIAYHFLESDDEARALQYSLLAGDKMMSSYYDADLALGYYVPALQMVISDEPALRRLSARFPVAIRHGVLHRFTVEEREAVVAYLAEALPAVRETPAAKAVARLANRICVVVLHNGDVYQASIRLYEQCVLGPDVQKLVVETGRGGLVGILEFPGPGGPYPVVLIFHGTPASKELMADDARRYLARGLATLRVDLPGFGETTVPATQSPADAEILKEMVTAVLAHDRVDSRGVGIAGRSSGSWYGAQLCARDDRVRALVSISGFFDWLDDLLRRDNPTPDARWRAFQEARWNSGALLVPDPFPWSADSPVFKVAGQIRCPMLLVYGALEPELFRAQAAELAALVPTAETRVWRSGVHVLHNVPEALEDAAEWMKQQLLGDKRT
jgi:transcriptional regulator with XRE-family HTH domain/dienelactone hydrolase